MSIVPEVARMSNNRVSTYPLHAALIGRRSRRFAKGASLDVGPLTYKSRVAPEPLTLAEEGALAFAAAGITGYPLAELPYGSAANSESGGGNIIVHLVGRTIASGDALHSAMLFVLNDEGTWFVKRPQDFAAPEVAQLVAAARQARFVDTYEGTRVRLSSTRTTIERRVPFVAPFNVWDTNIPGCTYFIPVVELTALYLNVLLASFSSEMGLFIVDDRARFRPAGIKRFARSRGGRLCDDHKDGRLVTVSAVETILARMASVEEGAMHHSMALMAEALGLGGFTHACWAPQWFTALGFDIRQVPFSKSFGLGIVVRTLMRLLGKPDPPIDLATGLRHPQHRDEWLVRTFSPPHYPDMRSAVLAFVEYKFANKTGTLTGNGPSAWRDGQAVKREIPRYSEEAIEATIAYSEYLYDRYGRFPATVAPFEMLLAYQAHHLDPDFYQRFYENGVLGDTQRSHLHGPDTR